MGIPSQYRNVPNSKELIAKKKPSPPRGMGGLFPYRDLGFRTCLAVNSRTTHSAMAATAATRTSVPKSFQSFFTELPLPPSLTGFLREVTGCGWPVVANAVPG